MTVVDGKVDPICRPQLVSLGGYVYVALAVAALFVFLGRYDPDYEAYRLLYETGGGWLAEYGRDPLFLMLINTFSDNLSLTYEGFRYILCTVIGASLFLLLPRLRIFSQHHFGFISAIFLTPFIFLKLHVQIREGLALLIWLFAVTSYGGILYRSVRSVSFWCLAVLSCMMHASVIIWWLAAVTCGLGKRPTVRGQAIATFVLFLIFGAATTTPGRELLIDGTFLKNYIYFSSLDNIVDNDPSKYFYWFSFLLLPLMVLAIAKTGAFTLPVIRNYTRRCSILGLLGTFGLLGLFQPVLLGTLVWGANEGDFIASLRIAATLVMFLALHLGFRYPKSFVSWIVFMFVLSDAVRITIVQFI
jgi:hypothetical protein